VAFPPHPVITEDNVTISIDTVFYFTITDPFRATYGWRICSSRSSSSP
jgi:regulator of protease activity HflC (stomatin/prohibitin superfamily)